MANLAIKGHPTRGKEVIQLLEMLGGVNAFNLEGAETNSIYYIDKDKNKIYHCLGANVENVIVFTLEEFEEKFPYKVGDKVKAWINGYRSVCNIRDMSWDGIVDEIEYKIQDYWYNTMNLQPYKEETMETISIDDFKANTKEWLIDKLESMSKDNALQAICNIHDELHKPKYPKTYAECCEVLSLGKDGVLYTEGYKASLIQDFQKLIICRNAYWKIAGEEMGLEKPWEPDFDNENEYKYGLFRLRNSIYKDATCINPTLLIFPTKEMRDAFYENFKDLIEQCKELL